MNKPLDDELKDYYKAAESWADDRAASEARSVRLAWIIAGAAGFIALAEAIAIAVMMPLKTVEPYAVLVDRQTGYVEKLDLAKGQAIVPGDALTRSMLAQYVIARENFDIAALKDNYRKVALWSAGDARDQYVAAMQATNPASPLASLPRQTVIQTEVRSISDLGADSVLVRFATTRTDLGGQPVPQGTWAAVIRYRFSAADMSEASRLDNPLGFQVLRYSKSAEIAPDPAAVAAPTGIPIGAVPVAASPAPVNPAGSRPAPR